MKQCRETGLGQSPAQGVQMLPIALRTPYLGHCPVDPASPASLPASTLSPVHWALATQVTLWFLQQPTFLPSSGVCKYSSCCLECPSTLPLPVQCPSLGFRTWLKCSCLWEKPLLTPQPLRSSPLLLSSQPYWDVNEQLFMLSFL